MKERPDRLISLKTQVFSHSRDVACESIFPALFMDYIQLGLNRANNFPSSRRTLKRSNTLQ